MARLSSGTSGTGPSVRGVTRRDALRLALAAGACAAALPAMAGAEESTQEKLDAARDDKAAAEAELERIGQEYEAIAAELADTTTQVDDLTAQIADKQAEIDDKQAEIDAKQDQIDDKQAEIDEKQDQIEAKQEVLGDRMSSAYKAGSTSTLDLLLSSATFEELTSNIYYLDKISESDRSMIDEIRSLKAELEQERAELEQERAELESQRDELEQQKADLEADRSELEGLQAQQQSQLDEARAKQEESQELVDSLSKEVQDLVDQYDAELRAAQEEALKAAQAGTITVTGTGSLADVIAAAYSTPSPGSGLCAAWVHNVFRRAGVGTFHGNADDLYYRYCSYSTSQIQPGMIVATNSVPYSYAALLYGHVGIYLGNGVVRHNASGVLREDSLDQFVSSYSVTSPVRCGWEGGVALA